LPLKRARGKGKLSIGSSVIIPNIMTSLKPLGRSRIIARFASLKPPGRYKNKAKSNVQIARGRGKVHI
jgi:hypothetical protein